MRSSTLVFAVAASVVSASKCTLTGYSSVSQPIIGSSCSRGGCYGGKSSTSSGFQLSVDGKKVGSSTFEDHGSNPIGVGGVKIPGKELGLGEDIEWKPGFDLFVFKGCSMKYKGKESKGSTDGDSPCGGSGVDKTLNSNTCSHCKIDFDCDKK